MPHAVLLYATQDLNFSWNYLDAPSSASQPTSTRPMPVALCKLFSEPFALGCLLLLARLTAEDFEGSSSKSGRNDVHAAPAAHVPVTPATGQTGNQPGRSQSKVYHLRAGSSTVGLGQACNPVCTSGRHQDDSSRFFPCTSASLTSISTGVGAQEPSMGPERHHGLTALSSATSELWTKPVAAESYAAVDAQWCWAFRPAFEDVMNLSTQKTD
jgi:hypothetical protein